MTSPIDRSRRDISVATGILSRTQIVTAEPGHRPPLFLGRKVENAWWKLGAPLRSSGVRSLVRIAFFVASFPQQKVQKITKNDETI